jgi:DNA replication protein DnaC
VKQEAQALEIASVQQYCRAARLPAVAANFVRLAGQAAKEGHTYVRYLEALLQVECEERDRHAVENRVRDAQIPRVKTLDDFDYSKTPMVPATRIRELAEGGYIDRSEPVVLIGDSGTGKTHLATGLCLAACRQKRRVRFTTAAGLVNELIEAKQQNQVRRVMAKWQKYELIVVDEWTSVFPNPRLCKALLDRVTDRAHILDTGKESYRFMRTKEGRQKAR